MKRRTILQLAATSATISALPTLAEHILTLK